MTLKQLESKLKCMESLLDDIAYASFPIRIVVTDATSIPKYAIDVHHTIGENVDKNFNRYIVQKYDVPKATFTSAAHRCDSIPEVLAAIKEMSNG